MRTLSTLCLAVLFFATPLFAADTIDSYVTRTGTPQDFDLGGTHIICNAETQIVTPISADIKKSIHACKQQTFGQHLTITGRLNKKTHTLTADRIELLDLDVDLHLNGFSYIDAVFTPTFFRADGHAIVIEPSTKIKREKDLTTTNSPAVNQWVKYEGTRRADGAIVATALTLSSPEITEGEQKQRDKTEFDPSKNDETTRQGGVSKFFKGKDYKRIPASKDTAIQQRIEDIGNKLIPPYQRNLPDDDPRKLNFRFQLVHGMKNAAVTLPSGITLVEEDAVKALGSDDQIAFLMAFAMSTELERLCYRYLPAGYTMLGTQTAGTVASFFIPGVGLAAMTGNAIAQSKIEKMQTNQVARVALSMMHDAGYDVDQAPLSVWHLERGRPDYMERPPTELTIYLFQTLTTDWAANSPLRKQP